ncbi:uncharacterized protein LOC107274373 isoform X2 [Cephus cinctus]|nr:uncharacterized protein LOC107274373 isoform X2 [Cephus cinctus]
MFIYPLYEIKKLKNEFRKHFAPTDIHFMCLCMHGHAAVDVIHRFTTYNDKSKFAIAFVINNNELFEFSTSTKKKSTFEVILIDSIVFLSGNVAPLCSDFHRWKRESLARLERYLSREEEFCLGICEESEKNIEVIIIFEDKDGFGASAIELEQEITKLRNLTRRMHLTHNATATQSDEASPVIDFTESEDTNTLPDISETSTKSNQLETWESERKIKSRISTDSEELRHTKKNIESVCKTVTEQFEIFGTRRLSDNVSSGRQPQFLSTSFKLLNSIQFITMGVMIDCNSPQTEFRSRGAYDLEFDQFLANKDKK